MKKNIIRIDEDRFCRIISKIVNESVTRILNESDDIEDDYIDGDTEDDWQSEEPSESDLFMAMKDIEQHCENFNLKFKDLGNGEFGVMCNVGSDCDIKGFMKLMQDFIDQGMLNKLGVGTTLNGIWHAKFKILKCW